MTTMLATSLFDLHTEGGPIFMLPIDILLIINLSLIGYLLFNFISKKSLPSKPMKTLKHIGGLALAWGAFSTLFGLFEAFRAIEAWQGPLAASIIYGGMKVVLITILYGFTTYLISLLAYIIFKVVGKTS